MLRNDSKRLRIGFVGAGNVATHLACHLYEKDHNIVAISSKSINSATELARKVDAFAIENLSYFPSDLDFLIIAASDSAINDISISLPQIDGIVVHTSGSIPLSVLSENHKRAAVLYPLQTFSKECPVDISSVPFFIEASEKKELKIIENFAKEFSQLVYEADSAIRATLHIAGVLSSNFIIYLLEMTRKVLGKAGLPLSTVKPLIEASISKAFSSTPVAALTGPARRGDKDVVSRQSDTFTDPLEKDIYDSISRAIMSEFKHIP